MEERCEYSQISIPIDPAYGRPVAKYIGEVAKKIGFDEDNIKRIEEGVELGIQDVIAYSFEPGENGNLDISCERIPEGLKLVIRDKGLPADTLPRPMEGSWSGPGRESDLGPRIFRLQEYLDEIFLHNLGPEGKETILIKHLKSKTLRDYVDACELEPFVRPFHGRPAPVEKPAFTVRRMKPSEAIEVSKCIYRAYGYSYGYEDAYYPERIMELNRVGRMVSAVAVTGKNEIAGHCALLFSEDTPEIAEMAQAVVKPEFRSQGILTRLTEYLIEEGKSRGLTGLFVQAVTVHTRSQRVALRLGLGECAVVLGYFPKTETFKGIAEDLPRRVGVVLGFKYLKKPGRLAVYPPPSHEEWVMRLYEHLEMRPQSKTPSRADALGEGRSVVKTKLIGRMRYVHIEIQHYGQSIVREIRAMLKDFCLKQMEVITLYLNLCDPLTHAFTGEFEKLGFFFSGILPGGTFEGDALVLQYLNNVPVNYEEIKVESAFSRELLSYVKSRDPNLV